MVTFTCLECKLPKIANVGSGDFAPHICGECKDKKEREAKASWLAERSKHTLAERIAFIEQWIYEHERKKPIHVSPPQY